MAAQSLYLTMGKAIWRPFFTSNRLLALRFLSMHLDQWSTLVGSRRYSHVSACVHTRTQHIHTVDIGKSTTLLMPFILIISKPRACYNFFFLCVAIYFQFNLRLSIYAHSQFVYYSGTLRMIRTARSKEMSEERNNDISNEKKSSLNNK